MRHLLLFLSCMAIFLLGVSGCNNDDVDNTDIDNTGDYGSSYDEADPDVTKQAVTDSPGTLFYDSEYKLFGIFSSKSPDPDDNNAGITIDTRYLYLIKGLKEKLPEDIGLKEVTFSGKYYPSGIESPVAGTTIFFITDIILNYK